MSVIVIRALFNEPFFPSCCLNSFHAHKWARKASSIKHPDRVKWVRGQSTPSCTSFSVHSESLTNYFGFVFARSHLPVCRVYQDHYWNVVCAAVTWISHRKQQKKNERRKTEEVKSASDSLMRLDVHWEVRTFNICENLLREIYRSLESYPRSSKIPRQSINVNGRTKSRPLKSN